MGADSLSCRMPASAAPWLLALEGWAYDVPVLAVLWASHAQGGQLDRQTEVQVVVACARSHTAWLPASSLATHASKPVSAANGISICCTLGAGNMGVALLVKCLSIPCTNSSSKLQITSCHGSYVVAAAVVGSQGLDCHNRTELVPQAAPSGRIRTAEVGHTAAVGRTVAEEGEGTHGKGRIDEVAVGHLGHQEELAEELHNEPPEHGMVTR